MAERIDSITRARRGIRRDYPWETWMDGSAWRIRRGEDFETPVHNMGQLIRQRAKRDGITVQVSADSEAGTVEFQFEAEAEQAAA